MLTRTSMCKHKHSCYSNIVVSAAKSFVVMYGFKVAMNALFSIANPIKFLKKLLTFKDQSDNIRFALCYTVINAVYKLVLCLSRRVFKNDKIGAALAGFLSGLCCFIDAKNRR